MRRFTLLGSVLGLSLFVGAAIAQQTPPTSQGTAQPAETPLGAGTAVTPTDMSAAAPATTTSTQVERTVVPDRNDAGKWGLLGLLGLLGLTGMRRRERDVTVVDRTVTRPPTPPTPSGSSTRR